MARRARAVLASFLALSLIPLPARAAYDDVGTSARITGMSNAYTAVADDVYSTYYNPAGLATLDRPEAAASYTRLLTGLSDGSNIQNSFLAYAYPLQGGKGTIATALNYFTLDSLYRETSLFASYGRAITREDNPNPIFVGISEKYLNRALGGTSAAGNAIGPTGIVQVGTQDPVLQSPSKTNFDTDIGALWRVHQNWNFGLDIQHLLQPNIAFYSGEADTLQRNIKLGAAYHTPFSTLSTDLDFMAAPDGSTDKDLNVGVEKWLPTLLFGSFALRGGFGLGSRDYRQLTVGLSYKIHRMQIDYGFAIPVGGLGGTSGTQRFGMTWRFGGSQKAEALLGDMLLENLASSAQVGTPEFNKQAAELVAYKRKAVDILMRDADAEAELGHFERAHEQARQAASLAPRDSVLADLDERYRTAAAYFPDVSGVMNASAGAATHDGLMKFVAGKDKEALASLVNARALSPTPAHDMMIRILEAKIGESAPAVTTATAVVLLPAVSSAAAVSAAPAASTETVVSAAPAVSSAAAVASPTSGADALKRILDSTSALMEVSFFQQEWDKVVELGTQVVALDPGNVLAYKRLAGAYHAMNKHAEALKALKAAYALEPDEAERAKLKAYITALKAVIDKAKRPAVAAKPARQGGSPEDVEKLYEAGVELYAQGRLIEAREAFKRCLQIDENYVPAQRAFSRVQAEMMQTGKDR